MTAASECRRADAPQRTRARGGSFAGLLFATAASVAANAMVLVLVPWLVLARTESAAQAGLVATVSFAATVPALLIGGPLIDRLGRRRIAVAADLLSAASVAALPLLDAVVGLSLALTLALIGVGALFDAPGGAAREASRPDVAEASGAAVTTVNAGGEASEGLGEIAGPALAGVGIGLVGASTSLWATAALLVAAAFATWASLPPDHARPRGEPRRLDALAGMKLLFRDPTLRTIALLSVSGMLFAAPLTLVVTVHSQRVDDPGLLALVAGAIAAGGIAGAIGYGVIAGRIRRRTALVVALAGAAAGLAALAGAIALDAHPVALAAAGLMTGLAVGPVNPVLAATLQERTEPSLRGRVVAADWAVSLAATPVGIAAVGLMLEVTDAAVVVGVLAGGVALVGVYAASARPLHDMEAS